jgi:hypothetical protein
VNDLDDATFVAGLTQALRAADQPPTPDLVASAVAANLSHSTSRHPGRRLRERGRAITLVAASVAVVAAISVAVVVAAPRHRSATPSTTGPRYETPTRQFEPNSLPGPSGPEVSVSDLRAYTWRSLPAAPIAARVDAATVWTGREMIVWGGQTSSLQLRGDGAAYQPSSHSWQLLPPGPLSPRISPTAVWSAGRLVMWGGSTAQPQDRMYDGATYDPTTRSWTSMPAAPIQAYQWIQAFSTGATVTFLATTGRSDPSAIHAYSYDVATNTWTTLPALRLPMKPQLLTVTALAVGSTVLVWADWGSLAGSPYGIDTYALDTSSSRWALASVVQPAAGLDEGQPVWTGQVLIMPGAQTYCGECRVPMPTPTRWFAVDPRTGARTVLKPGLLARISDTYVWTGAALLAIDGFDQVTEGGTHIAPGDIAGWDQATNRWTSLAPAGLTIGASATVWTGTELLVWGLNEANPKGATANALEFGP